jgi:hypothetical protein
MNLPRKKRDETSATITPTLILIVVCSGLFVLTAAASDPDWWTTRGALAPEFTTNGDGTVTQNYLPTTNRAVTEGQLKQFTARAVDELNADLPGGAGSQLGNLVAGWSNAYAAGQFSQSNPDPTNSYAIDESQLKYVGNLVWSRLVAGGYTNAVPSWLAQNSSYDRNLVTVPEIKTVFNFELPKIPAPTPTFNPMAGTYVASQIVTITSTPGSTIYYTTDGSTPVPGQSTSMTSGSSILVRDSETIQAVSEALGYQSSGTATASYTIQMGAPTQLTVTPQGASELTLNWINNASGDSSIIVEESTDGGNTWTAIATLDPSTTSYSVNGLNSSAYMFNVVASNGTQQSTSASSTGTTPESSTPIISTGVYDSSGHMNLSWNTVWGATSYIIDREYVPTATWTTGFDTTSSTSYIDTSVWTGGYRYRVSAVTSTGVSGYSNVFPASQYAVIDLGENPNGIEGGDVFINNSGTVVSTDDSGLYEWQGGAKSYLLNTPAVPGQVFLDDENEAAAMDQGGAIHYWSANKSQTMLSYGDGIYPAMSCLDNGAVYGWEVFSAEYCDSDGTFIEYEPYEDGVVWSGGFGPSETGDIFTVDGTFGVQGQYKQAIESCGGHQLIGTGDVGDSRVLDFFTLYNWTEYVDGRYIYSDDGNGWWDPTSIFEDNPTINSQGEILGYGGAALNWCGPILQEPNGATTILPCDGIVLNGATTSITETDGTTQSVPNPQILGLYPGLIGISGPTLMERSSPSASYSWLCLNDIVAEGSNYLIQPVDSCGINDADMIAITGVPLQNGIPQTDSSGAWASHTLALLPMELKSNDRMITGSVQLPQSWTGISLHFVNTTTGQDLGTFNNIVENMNATTPAFKIYNTKEDMFSDAEAQQDLAGTLDSSVTQQKVVFYKDDNNPQLLHFATTFDSLGTVQVQILQNGTQIGYNAITLTADTNFSSVISEVDNRITSPSTAPVVDPTDPNDPAGSGGNGGSNLIVAQEPGSMSNPGTIDPNESDPTQLVLPLHTGTALPAATDNDLSLVTLRRPIGLTYNTGTITLAVSSPSSVTLFSSDASHILVNYSVDLAAPVGDLAALATGNAQVWVRGAAPNSDVTLTYTYTDANGVVQQTSALQLSVSTSGAMVWPGAMRDMPLFCGTGAQGINGSAMSLMSMKVWSSVAQAAPTPPSNIKNDGLTTKVMLAVFGLVTNQLTAEYYIGVAHGFGGAAYGDLNTLGNIVITAYIANDPIGQLYLAHEAYATANSIYQSLYQLSQLTLAQQQQVLNSLVISAGIQVAGAVFQWQSLTPNQQQTDIEYAQGYVTGYLLEQVVVCLGTAGGAEALKGAIVAAEAGNVAVTMAKPLQVIDTAVTVAAESDPANVALAKDAFEKGAAEVYPGLNLTDGEAIANGLAPLDSTNGQSTLQAFTQEVDQYTKGTQWSLQGKDAFVHLADLLNKLGPQASAKAVKGLARTFGRLIVAGQPDRYLDLLQLFKDSSGNIDATNLNATLEAAYDALAADTQPGPSVFLEGMDAIHGTGYRYADNLSFLTGQGGTFPVNNGTGWWCSFDEFSSALEAQTKLQLPAENSARYRIEFDLAPVTDEIRLPYGNNDSASYFEPVARDHPNLPTPGAGVGGGTQVKITGSGGIRVKAIFDYQIGQYISIPQ